MTERLKIFPNSTHAIKIIESGWASSIDMTQRTYFTNQTRFPGFELHKMEQFGSRRPIRYWCYWLSEVVVTFQSEDILSYPNSVLTYPNASIDWYQQYMIPWFHDPKQTCAPIRTHRQKRCSLRSLIKDILRCIRVHSPRRDTL